MHCLNSNQAIDYSSLRIWKRFRWIWGKISSLQSHHWFYIVLTVSPVVSNMGWPITIWLKFFYGHLDQKERKRVHAKLHMGQMQQAKCMHLAWYFLCQVEQVACVIFCFEVRCFFNTFLKICLKKLTLCPSYTKQMFSFIHAMKQIFSWGERW